MRDSAFDLLLWRSLLPGLSEVPDAEDQVDWASLCVAAGLNEPARMIYETAFVRQGFSAAQRRRQAEIAVSTGLWDSATSAPDLPAGQGTLEIAVAELKQLSAQIAHRLSPRGVEPPAMDVSGLDPLENAPSAAVGSPQLDMAELANRLYLFLSDPASSDNWDAADALLRQIWISTRRLGGIDHRTFSSAPLPLLATAVGVIGLRDFALSNQDLMFGPLGSAELLRRTAQLDSAGLGPYFSNVAQLARSGRDVFDLAQVAVDAAEAAGIRDVGLDSWVVLLSRQLGGALLDEVVDDLGDRGDMAALWMMFDRASRQPPQKAHFGLILRLRDAALDNGDYGLAGRAQDLVARMRPDHPLERMILGSIQASGGDFAAAEQTFLNLLRRAPDDQDVRQRLRAVRAGSFDGFQIGHGFGTPQVRLIYRLRRRGQIVTGPRVTGKRAAAVEFY